jgi:hypothetical protein
VRFSRALGLAVVLLFSLFGPTLAESLRPSTGIDSATGQAESFVPRNCKELDWGILDIAEAKNLFSDYDFDPFVPGHCTTIDVKWMPAAQIVRLKAATMQVDDSREITLLRASPESRVWLIPLEKGMVGYRNTPDDLHHLAAFNDLLRTARVRITNDNVADVSDLYQFVVGMEMKPGPPSTDQDSL